MKRFYSEVATEACANGYRVLLDQRPIKTQSGNPQIVPTDALAQTLAAEWAAQGETIDPAKFRFRDHADYAIDIVGSERDATIARLVGFGQTDTLCYRADPGEALFRRQTEMWDPLVEAIEALEGVRFVRVSGIVHHEQPPETLASLRGVVAQLDDFSLAGLHAIASLSASLCIALAALQPDADPAALFALSELEEDWQAEMWGRDAEADHRRALRAADFTTAHAFLKLVR